MRSGGRFGAMQQLGYLVVLYYATVVFFVFGILGLILRLAGFSIFKFLRYLREGKLPEWEVPNMLVKYGTIMEAYRMSRGSAATH